MNSWLTCLPRATSTLRLPKSERPLLSALRLPPAARFRIVIKYHDMHHRRIGEVGDLLGYELAAIELLVTD
jgi:hypothetical protein